MFGGGLLCDNSHMIQKLMPRSGRCCNKNLNYEAVALEPGDIGRLGKTPKKLL